jgi:hypothetical protein
MCNYSKNYAESSDDGKHAARLSKEDKIRLQRRTAKHETLVDRRQEAAEKKDAAKTQ